jgi:drug/metabolite transporter (DMT)-like permease
MSGERRRGQIYIALAAVAWSTAGVLQRELSLSTTTQIAGRAVFAAVTLAVFVGVSMRGDALRAFRSIGRAGLAFAVSTAVASSSFIVALNHTSVANVLFLQAASPIAAALLARLTLGEPISRRAWAAMLVALCGVAIMLGGPGGGEYFGFGVSLLMTLAFAVSIVISRHRRDISMAPATCLSQVLVVVAAAPFATPSEIGSHDLVLLVVLGVGQMGLGLALFTVGARLLPAAEIALITLLEVVLGPLWVWIVLSEHPSAATIAGGAVVTAAVVLQTTGDGASRSPVPH